MHFKSTALATLFAVSMGAYAADTKTPAPQVITTPSEQQVFKSPETFFTGDATVRILSKATKGITAGSAYVTFAPNARTLWHTHPVGQYIVITEGDGLVQEWGKPAQKVSVGDVVYFPPALKHWHGATQTSEMTQFALTGVDEEGNNVTWLAPISDEQFAEANQ